MAARSNLSISNSEADLVVTASPAPLRPARTVTAALIALTLLALADITLSRWYAMPQSNLVMPTALQQYFDYGRSVEGKLRRMAGTSLQTGAALAQQGWLAPAPVSTLAATAASARLAAAPDGLQRTGGATTAQAVRVAVYGQSFTMQIADLLPQLEPRWHIVRRQGAPAAPLSHSYAAYRADTDQPHADVILVGILASSLPRLVSLSNMTAWFEAPTPYTYPRYRLADGTLQAQAPLIGSYAELRRALQQPAAWRAFANQLRASDAAYDGALFESDWLDHSLLARLARRGYGQRHLQQLEQRYHGSDGFRNRDGLLEVSNALLLDMARLARSRQQQLVVVLIGDRGYGDHLSNALAPALAAGAITHLSTAVAASASDSSNFIADGHFTPAANRRLALALRDTLRALPVTRTAP